MGATFPLLSKCPSKPSQISQSQFDLICTNEKCLSMHHASKRTVAQGRFFFSGNNEQFQAKSAFSPPHPDAEGPDIQF